MSSPRGMHRCPAHALGCEADVPNAWFACRQHWFVLPLPIRNAINRTARLGLLASQRRNAVQAASAEYRRLAESAQARADIGGQDG